MSKKINWKSLVNKITYAFFKVRFFNLRGPKWLRTVRKLLK